MIVDWLGELVPRIELDCNDDMVAIWVDLSALVLEGIFQCVN